MGDFHMNYLSPFVQQELKPGDRIQAKWVDGRMYFGKVVKVHEGESSLHVAGMIIIMSCWL